MPFSDPATAVEATIAGTVPVQTQPGSVATTQAGSVASPEWAAHDFVRASLTNQVPSVIGSGIGGGTGVIYTVGNAQTLILHFVPTVQDQVLFITWYSTVFGTLALGQLILNVKAGQALDYATFNRSGFVEVISAVSVGGLGRYALDVATTDRPIPPGVYLRATAYDGVIADTGDVTIAAGGVSASFPFAVPYTGPATLAFAPVSATTAIGIVSCNGADYAAVSKTWLSSTNFLVQQIFVPPLINSIQLGNLWTASTQFRAKVVAALPR